jgi:hypothetical protein
VLELVRNHPAFAADLLGQLLHVELPHFTEARLAESTLNELVPVEYRADAVVLFEDTRPVYGAILEAQLQRDDQKLFSWPAYAVVARARHRCPFVVIVVTPDPAVARWAGQQVDLGGGDLYRTLVVGPENIPQVTDRSHALRDPQLAVLSVMAHGQGDVATAAAIGRAAADAISSLPQEQRELYSILIEAALSEAARKVVEMQPGLEKFFTEAQRRFHDRGKAEGKA